MVTKELTDELSELSHPFRHILLEYYQLTSMACLSEEQQERLQQILDLAGCSEGMAFWLAELDHVISHKLGVLDSDKIESYKDQQALLREYLTSEVITCGATLPVE